LLYKDESFRNRLIQKGIDRVKEFSWDKTAELMWQAVMKSYPGSHGASGLSN
jgi:hypothetical protein